MCFAFCGEIILREEFLWRDLGEIFFLVFTSDGIAETEFFGGIFWWRDLSTGFVFW